MGKQNNMWLTRKYLRSTCKFSVKSHWKQQFEYKKVLFTFCTFSIDKLCKHWLNFIMLTRALRLFYTFRESDRVFCNWSWLCLRDVAVLILRKVKTRRKKTSHYAFLKSQRQQSSQTGFWFFFANISHFLSLLWHLA